MPTRQIDFALCIGNRGADDLETGEDYLYPSDYFVSVELPPKATRALAAPVATVKRRYSSNKRPRTVARAVRPGR